MATYCDTPEGNMQYGDDPYCFTSIKCTFIQTVASSLHNSMVNSGCSYQYTYGRNYNNITVNCYTLYQSLCMQKQMGGSFSISAWFTNPVL